MVKTKITYMPSGESDQPGQTDQSLRCPYEETMGLNSFSLSCQRRI